MNGATARRFCLVVLVGQNSAPPEFQLTQFVLTFKTLPLVKFGWQWVDLIECNYSESLVAWPLNFGKSLISYSVW